MSEYVLAIDQGTTGTTALLLDRAGAVRARGYALVPQHYPKPGWVEHDPEQIWQSVRDAVGEALQRSGANGRAVRAIGITNQRETTVAWERATGRPVAHAIVWQDRRTTERCAELRRQGLERELRRRTGLVADPYFSATKLEWLLRHTAGLRGRARAGAIAFGTVDSWVVWRLSGGAAHVTDPTNASRTLLFDLARRRWDPALLERFGVPERMLPEVVPSSGECATTRGAEVLPDGIPIAGIAGDQQAALFGQGCVRPGMSKNTYGTGCFLLRNIGDRPIASRAGLLTTVACGPRGEAAYALEGSVFIAGAAIQWLRDELRILGDAAESDALARSVEGTGGVMLVPAFVGLGAPYWRADARGALLGITRGTGRAHVVRAALESMAFQTRDVFEAMAEDVRRTGGRGGRIASLRVDGGAAANDFLMQFQADLLGVAVERPAVIETTALGAGLLAGLATGFWTSPSELDVARRVERRFEPERPKRWRDEEQRRWKAAVAAVLTMADVSV